jgi:hypothetical protein
LSCRPVLVVVGVVVVLPAAVGSNCWRLTMAPSRRSALRRWGAAGSIHFWLGTAYLCRRLAERRSTDCPLTDLLGREDKALEERPFATEMVS